MVLLVLLLVLWLPMADAVGCVGAAQYQQGGFPPVRVDWDYKDAAKIPKPS